MVYVYGQPLIVHQDSGNYQTRNHATILLTSQQYIGDAFLDYMSHNQKFCDCSHSRKVKYLLSFQVTE